MSKLHTILEIANVVIGKWKTNISGEPRWESS